MFGAHLDGVSAGPGINDNATGSSTLLENALVLAAQNPTMTKKVRFAWWTDEEQGLNGSRFYVNSLNTTQRGYIKGYYNFDMVGSANGGYFINRVTSTTAAPLKAYWDSLGLAAGGERRGPGPLRRLLLPAGRHPHLGLRRRGQRPQDQLPGGQVGRHRQLGVRPLLPPRL